MYRKH